MFELIQAAKDTFYLQSPAKIGIWRQTETDVYLIDSGNDKDAGRKVRQILEQNRWRLKGILNTHSNADHIGGNSYLQGKTGCPAFLPDAEAALTRHPLLEPTILFGAYPFRDLQGKFLMAAPSPARDLCDPAFPKEIEVIPLPGHFIDMVGYRTPDNAVFLADCVASEATMEKYGITFLFDIAGQLKTLDFVEQMDAAVFIPAHAEACADIRPLVRKNRGKTLEIADKLLSLCQNPVSFEDVLQQVFFHYQLTMNAMQYALVGSTVRSYLSWLLDTGRLTVAYDDNRMRWQRA